MLRILNIRLSRVAVLSQLLRVPLPKPVTPQVLGVDDFALYTASYGSLLVDATTRLTLTHWEKREAEQLGRWLREYPGVEGRLPRWVPHLPAGHHRRRPRSRAG